MATVAGATIRAATQSDLPQLLAMGERFFEASGYSDIVELDAGSLQATFEHLMSSKDGVLLVVEKGAELVGMAGALVYPFYFNTGHRTSQELFWWVDPEHRGVGGELFERLRGEVKAKGAASLSMIALESLEVDRVGAFYMRQGLRPSERSFIGRL